jgi:replication-associated recombination protein RarA
VDQEYVPTSKIYYHPTEEGYEKRIQERLARWAELRRQQRKRKQDE